MRRVAMLGAGAAAAGAVLVAQPVAESWAGGVANDRVAVGGGGLGRSLGPRGSPSHGYVDSCSIAETERCAESVRVVGAVLCPQVLAKSDFRLLRDHVAERANAVKPVHLFMRRYHYDLLKDGEVVERVERLFGPATDAGRLVRRVVGREDVVLTEVQLVRSRPGADRQIFHVDNARKGVTVAIALDHQPTNRGVTQLITGSQALFGGTGEVADGIASLARARVVSPELARGAAAVFDSRLVHRGMGNTSTGDRPLLVIRYDARETPPPQIGRAGTIAVATLGRLAAALLPHRTVPFSVTHRGGDSGQSAGRAEGSE